MFNIELKKLIKVVLILKIVKIFLLLSFMVFIKLIFCVFFWIDIYSVLIMLKFAVNKVIVLNMVKILVIVLIIL